MDLTSLDFNQLKTKILVKGISADDAWAAAQRITMPSSLLTPPSRTSPQTFLAERFVGLGVFLDTDTFVQDFVKKRTMDIINEVQDVDKLNAIDDGIVR